MTDKPALPQPNIRLQRTALAARLLAILKSSDDFEWACSVVESGGNGGKIVLTVDEGGYIKFISQEVGRKIN